MIHLDTSFLIRALHPGSSQDALLRAWLRDRQPLGMSALAWAEFLCGPIPARHIRFAERVVPARVPLGEEDAVRGAQIFNASGRRRGTLLDCLIAASAIRADAGLATANAADFRRLAGDELRILEA